MSDELTQLANDLCQILPGGWTIKPTENSWHDVLTREDGAVLYLTNFSQDSGRWHISSGADIEHAHDYLPHLSRFPSITVSKSKSADAIARDIERRILPKFEPLLAVVLGRKAESDAHALLTLTNARRLSPLVKNEEPTMESGGCRCEMSAYLDDDPTVDSRHARVTVNGNRVEMTLSDLTVDTAEAILRIANGLQPNKGE